MATLTRMTLAGLMCVGLASAAKAAPFVDINFDGDTLGAQPSTAASSNPLLKPTGIGGYTALTADSPPTAANGTMSVANVGGMTKATQMTSNPANDVLGALWVDTGFSQTSQQFVLSFDINILDGTTATPVQPKTLDGAGTVGILFGMNTFGTAQGPRFAAAPTSATGGVFAIRSPDNSDLQSFFSYTEGVTYNVKLLANYDTGLVSTYVDDVLLGYKPFATSAAAGVTTQEFFFHLNGDLGNANSVAIDNITAIPEPASLALIGLSAAGLLLRRRRNRA